MYKFIKNKTGKIIIKNIFNDQSIDIECNKYILILFFDYFDGLEKYGEFLNKVCLNLNIPHRIFQNVYKLVTEELFKANTIEYIEMLNTLEILSCSYPIYQGKLCAMIKKSVTELAGKELDEAISKIGETFLPNDVFIKEILFELEDKKLYPTIKQYHISAVKVYPAIEQYHIGGVNVSTNKIHSYHSKNSPINMSVHNDCYKTLFKIFIVECGNADTFYNQLFYDFIQDNGRCDYLIKIYPSQGYKKIYNNQETWAILKFRSSNIFTDITLTKIDNVKISKYDSCKVNITIAKKVLTNV